MTERDDIELGTWARRAFADEPEAGRLDDTIGDDLSRAHAALNRRRRWTAGVSGIAVASVAFAVAIAPGLVPSAGDDPEPAGTPESPTRHRQPEAPKQRQPAPVGDGYEYYAQRELLHDVAKDHLDPDGDNLGWASSVQTSTTASDLNALGTEMGWRVPGEDGLGMVQVGIGAPGLGAAEVRLEWVLCGEAYTCEERELSDGSTAWVGRSDDGRLGVGYQQDDGEWVWVLVAPLFGNRTTTPVSSVDITIDQALGFVADDRLEFQPGPPCTQTQTTCLRTLRAEREAERLLD
jgi:hypothetical protein